MSAETFAAAIRTGPLRTALVFVPGFNTSFEEGAFRLAQITFDMQFEGSPILFSWPSAAQGIATYDYDRESALYSRQQFLQLLEIVQRAGVDKLYVVAHSMGNQIVVDALDQAARLKMDIGSLSELRQ